MARPPSASLTCLHCSKGFTVPNHRAHTAKFCSRVCSDAHPRKRNESRCRECGSLFPIKASQAARSAAWGSFCSAPCNHAFRSRATVGSGNSNWRGRNFDQYGYRLFSPQASLTLGLGRIKEHHAVALSVVGLKKIPKDMHIHHRDCDRQNNGPNNLHFMTVSDHRWLHHQFGVAVLRAIAHGEIEVDHAAGWSDDPIRATGLLLASVVSQAAMLRYMTSKFGVDDLGVVSAIRPVRVTFQDITNLNT